MMDNDKHTFSKTDDKRLDKDYTGRLLARSIMN